jgi:hypothetical protein
VAAADVVAAATGEKGIGRRQNGGDWGRRLGFAPCLALLSLRDDFLDYFLQNNHGPPSDASGCTSGRWLAL